jgi:aspartate/methionine/tyrosine aminotransferase
VSSSPRLASHAARIRPGVFAALEDRIAKASREGRSLVPFHIGDTYLTPPEASRAALLREGAELHRYGPTAGLPELRSALASYVHERGRASDVSPSRVFVGAGGTHALHCLSKVLFDPGDEVVLLSPYWPLAPGIFEAQGASCIEVPMAPYVRDGADFATRLRAACGPKTRAIYFVSPGNPDGRVLSREELEVVRDMAVEHDAWVLADEVYADVTYDVPHVSFGRLEGLEERTVQLYSFSKSFALAGQRVGFAVAPERLVAPALRVAMHTVFNVPLASQRAALAALSSPEAFLGPTREAYRATRDAVARELSRRAIAHTLPDAGVYFFLDLSPVTKGRPLADFLRHAIDHGVLLAPGEAFGRDFSSYARLCFTSVPHEATLAGIDALARAVETF